MMLNLSRLNAINPQPLPPSHETSRFEKVALNPQPLPPAGMGGGVAMFDEDGPRCGNEPRHFPPLPLPVGPLGELLKQIGVVR